MSATILCPPYDNDSAFELKQSVGQTESGRDADNAMLAALVAQRREKIAEEEALFQAKVQTEKEHEYKRLAELLDHVLTTSRPSVCH